MKMKQPIPYHILSEDEQDKRAEDIVLLFPVFQSVQTDEDEQLLSPCLHMIRLPDARLGLCNVLAEQTCACCNCPMCEQHQSEQWIELPDAQSVWNEEHIALLCETCALLPKETISALHAFRVSINAARKSTPSLHQNGGLSHPMKEQQA